MQGYTPPEGYGQVRRNPANEETAVLTPVTDGTSALDRIPLSQRKLWMVACSVLGVLLLVFLGTTIYLANVSNDWERTTNQVIDDNYDLGAQLAKEQKLIIEQQAQIDLLNQQLDTSKSQVTELADIVAQSEDQAVFVSQEVSNLRELLATASAVSNALNRCVDGQAQLAAYLREPENYDPEELEAYEVSVGELCAAAEAANSQLQLALTQ